MLELGGEHIDAISVGGRETCIQLPKRKFCFDIGRCPPSAVRMPNVLFTHAHVDHMGGVAHHCAQRDLLGMTPPKYFIPMESNAAFDALMTAWRALSQGDFPCEVVPMEPGDKVPLSRNQWIRTFRAIHRIPSVGYVVGSTKRKLKQDLQGASQQAIRDAAQAGHTVTEDVEYPEVAFCGDTCIDVLKREPWVRKAKVLILEMTFLDQRVSVDSARAHGHVHLDEVIEHADLFENEYVLFTHFSPRYRNDEILQAMKRLPPSLAAKAQPLLFQPPYAPVKSDNG